LPSKTPRQSCVTPVAEFFNSIDPDRLSSANLFCTARFLFDHLVNDGEHAGRDGQVGLNGRDAGAKARAIDL
jgi:hypothetical protein